VNINKTKFSFDCWVLAIIAVFAGVLLDFSAMALAAEPLLQKMDLFEENTDGFVLYRIPGIVVTSKGSVLAYCEARKYSGADRGEIEIHMRRSTDGGLTWSKAKQIAHMGPRLARNPHMSAKKKKDNMGGPNEQTVNNPVAIADSNGVVHFIYCVEYMRSFYMRSTDDGVSWSKPVEITYAFEKFRPECPWQVIATGPGHGIQLSTGRLIVPVWLSTYQGNPRIRKASAVIFSDDGGATWQRGDIAIVGGNESNVARLSDGGVILTARNGDPSKRRAVTFSKDGVSGWSKTSFAPELLEPGCMAGMVSYQPTEKTKKHLLLFSNPHTTKRKHSARRNVSIKLSYDNGQTWPINKILENGPSAYSDLAVLPDGSILCFYESGMPGHDRPHRAWAYACLRVARFNLQWLMDGKDSPEDG
jgi:sialidase-1